jgi:hypothetical protein
MNTRTRTSKEREMTNQPSLGEQDQTIMTTAKALDIVTTLIEEYELDYGNAEAVITDGDDALLVSVEAPNNSTVSGVIPISKTTTKRDIVTSICDMMGEFDADDEFNELYSPEFMSHNGFTPSGFLAMLMEDQEYFEGKAEDFYKTRIAEN